jgi:hypothetical protein
MNDRRSILFTGGLFIAAGLMLALGWGLLPVKIDDFFKVETFGAIESQLRLWIWLFRIYLFGHLMAVMALVAFGTSLDAGFAKTVALPGIIVATSGLIVGAIGGAFYYHHGAWGALDMAGKSAPAIAEFVKSLKVDTEFATCLVRFARVFFGLGQTVFGLSLLVSRSLPSWLAWSAVALGVAAMALTMGLPDDLHLYMPIFYLNSVWFALGGFAVLRRAPIER